MNKLYYGWQCDAQQNAHWQTIKHDYLHHTSAINVNQINIEILTNILVSDVNFNQINQMNNIM